MYMSVSDAADKFNISKRRVQTLCEQGRIKGVNMVSGVWLIPTNAKKPEDARKKCSSYNQDSFFETLTQDALESLSLKQVCKVLSISLATAQNWIRLGKLKTNEDGKSFDKVYIENLVSEIKNGKNNRLKSRRNKKNINGKELYKYYIKNENNRKVVENILMTCEHISEEELRILLANFAIQLYNQTIGIPISNDWLCKKSPVSKNSVFNALITDLLSCVDLINIDLSNIKEALSYQVELVPSEDTLGFIYISLRDLGQRKQTGTYYTPDKTVNFLIDHLIDCIELKHKTICDPCCGTGNFLISLVNKGVSANNLYGQDIDEISVYIARINMFLLDNHLTIKQLTSQIICGNTLEESFNKSFSVVLGNPPWGYDYSEEKIDILLKNYRTAKSKGIESYDLFIEKGLQLLEKNGYMVYILPEAFLNVASHLQARKLIIEQTSFQFVSYLGNVFSGVQCPSIILGVKNDKQGSTKNCKVQFKDSKFIIAENRILNATSLSFNMTDEEYNCMNAISSIKNVCYLKNNAKFALGIVTGNNKDYIINEKKDGFETILKGKDITRYSINNSNNYIHYAPETFQQVAPIEMYRAPEKLLYRFISEVPVFSYDNHQRFSLNSCNILIPEIDGLNMKYILAILNSSVAAYFINKKFNSVKLLRAHIEALPIPKVNNKKQNEIIQKVDCIINAKENKKSLYDELDSDIMDLYVLSTKQRKIIKNALSNKNLFLN